MGLFILVLIFTYISVRIAFFSATKLYPFIGKLVKMAIYDKREDSPGEIPIDAIYRIREIAMDPELSDEAVAMIAEVETGLDKDTIQKAFNAISREDLMLVLRGGKPGIYKTFRMALNKYSKTMKGK